MVTKKKKRKKKGSGLRRKKKPWLIFSAVVVLFVVITGLLIFKVLSLDGGSEPTESSYLQKNRASIPYGEPIDFGEPAAGKSPGKKSFVAPESVGDKAGVDRPLVAIVIDDMGYNKKTCKAIIELDLNLSFAFLPFGSYTAKQAYLANRLGHDVLLHFPMEATDAKFNPGAGTITIDMHADEIQKIFNKNLASVPYAVGVNNHMGSRFTQNNKAMRIFMKLVQEEGLFFLDSRTTQYSIGYALAGKMSVNSAERDIFLDNVRDPQKIIIQLRKLVEVADQQGAAIAIGHPYPETLLALREYREELLRRVKVVGIKALVH